MKLLFALILVFALGCGEMPPPPPDPDPNIDTSKPYVPIVSVRHWYIDPKETLRIEVEYANTPEYKLYNESRHTAQGLRLYFRYAEHWKYLLTNPVDLLEAKSPIRLWGTGRDAQVQFLFNEHTSTYFLVYEVPRELLTENEPKFLQNKAHFLLMEFHYSALKQTFHSIVRLK